MNDSVTTTEFQKMNGHAETASCVSKRIELRNNNIDRGEMLRETLKAVRESQRMHIYQRGGQLVRIVDPPPPPEKAPAILITSKHIHRWTKPALECELTDTIRFTSVKLIEDAETGVVTKQTVPAPPLPWLATAMPEIKDWAGIPSLTAIIETPTIDSDCRVIGAPGYDHSTGLFCSLKVAAPSTSERPTPEDAREAMETLLDVVQDFPFVNNAHRAGWIAYVLTLASRFSFDGPTPLFWFDGATRGTGKTLLEQLGAIIALAATSWKAQWPKDEAEQNKTLTTLALKSPRSVCWDNLRNGSELSGPGLDQILTSTTWSGRILGANADYHGPWTTVLACTGNNVSMGGDMVDRVCHIRMESPHERPRDRPPTDFTYQDVEGHVRTHQPQLLAAALTILRAYHCAQRPAVKLTPWGSYNVWSAAVRAPIAWLKEKYPELEIDDPGVALQEMREQSNDEDLAAAAAISGLKNTAETKLNMKEWNSERMHEHLYGRGASGEYRHDEEYARDLRSALDKQRPENANGDPNVRQLGHIFRKLKGRTLSGLKLGVRVLHGKQLWSVVKVTQPLAEVG